MIGYLDCYSGLGGDMFLGALVDAGFPFTHLQDVVSALGLGDACVSRPDGHAARNSEPPRCALRC